MDTSGAVSLKPVWETGSAIGFLQFTPTAAGVFCPWISREEWDAVHSWLFSDQVEVMKRGVGRVGAWKARGQIPMAVEMTTDLIECSLIDQENISMFQSLNLTYSMAITRFVNGVNELVKVNGNTLLGDIATNVAQYNVPSWLVALRHCGTHELLPSLSALRTGAQFALSWLRVNYWEPQSLTIGDHDVSSCSRLVQVKERGSGNGLVWRLTRGLCKTKIELFHLLTTSSVSELVEHLKRRQLLQFPDNVKYHIEVPDVSDLTGFPDLSITDGEMAKWRTHLLKAASKDSFFKQRLVSAIITVVNESECCAVLRDYLGGWLGKLLTHHIDMEVEPNTSDTEIVYTADSHEQFLLDGQLDWKMLLNVVKECPGYYSMAVMNVILDHLDPQFSGSVLEKVRYLTTLVTLSSRISSSSYIPGTRYGHHERELEQLQATLEQLNTALSQQGAHSSHQQQLVVESESNCQRWQSVRNMSEWVNTPLGLHPNQQLSSTMFDYTTSSTPSSTGDNIEHTHDNYKRQEQSSSSTNRLWIASRVTLF